MKKRVVIAPKAAYRLLDAANWYENRQPGLSDRFLDDFKLVIDHIATFPEACQIQKRNFRFAKFRRFPYIVVYTYELNRITVRSIVNAKQDPAIRFR